MMVGFSVVKKTAVQDQVQTLSASPFSSEQRYPRLVSLMCAAQKCI